MPLNTTYAWSDTSTTTTWNHWVSNSTNATTTSSNTVWINWNNGTSTTGTLDNCWVTWVDEHGYTRRAVVNQNYNYNSYNAPATPPETEEQRAERQRRYAAQDEARKLADETAEQLLHSLLTDQQIADLRAHGHFFVKGSKSGKTYQIKKGYAGNVFLQEEGRRRKYCAHGRDSLPTFDHMVMQMLALEHDEDRFLQVANVS